jgi:acyl-coenzyme A thioesterase PaaI-like protein
MDVALQDRYAPDNICFGCGPANERGLQIKSFVEGDEVVCDFTPQEHHQAFPRFINGGIISAVFDCHMNWTAANQLMTSGTLPPTVTAEYSVRFRRPTPAGRLLHFRARVVDATDTRATVEATLEVDGEVCAEADGIFVAVSADHPAYRRWSEV